MATHLYVVVAGSLEVVHDDHVAARLGPGGVFGEMALFNRQRRVATIRAVDDTTLLAISNERLQPLVLRQRPAAVKLVQQLGALLGDRLRGLDLRLAERGVDHDPALAVALAEYRQLRQQILSNWALAYHSLGNAGSNGSASAAWISRSCTTISTGPSSSVRR